MTKEHKQCIYVKSGRVHAPTCKLPVLLPPNPKSSGPDVIVRKRKDTTAFDQTIAQYLTGQHSRLTSNH